MYFRASCKVNQSARSTSGNSCCRPDFGGHSIENMLLRISFGEQSPSRAHTITIFPLGCLICCKGRNSPAGAIPVSSSNSLFAASSGSSPSTYSPLGIDQAPTSLFFQNGPPGCTSNTSIWPSRLRYINNPALRFTNPHLHGHKSPHPPVSSHHGVQKCYPPASDAQAKEKEKVWAIR